MSVYAQEYGYFFNSNSGDRTYNASSFEEWLKPFFLPGVFNGEMQVTAQSTPDMTVTVAHGRGNLDGIPAYWPDDNIITIDTASGVYPRIDTIVLRRDNTNRAVSIEYVKGTAAATPQPVAPTRDSDIYELVLAQILVGTGVTAITADKITDTRMDADLCGWVAATVDQIDFDQIKTQFDAWQTVNQAQFEDWFQHLQDELNEHQAAHLQNEIDASAEMLAYPIASPTLYPGDYAIDPYAFKFYEVIAGGNFRQTKVADAIADKAGYAVAIVSEGAAPQNISKGQFVYLSRSKYPYGLGVGLYIAKKDISANKGLDSSDIQLVQDGGLNYLNSNVRDTFIFSNDSTYVDVGTNIAYNSSYTVPETGFYVLRSESDGTSFSAWYLDSDRSKFLTGNTNQKAVFMVIPLKKNTIIYTRNNSGGTYRVVGYYPI